MKQQEQALANRNEKTLLAVLNGKYAKQPPIWLMRQAGRYLPEYLATRKTAGSFLDLCYTPEFAVEVTLQPIRRFGFDAAILFSDILVIPDGLGQKVWFEAGSGPRLDALETLGAIDRLKPEGMTERLSPVYEAVRGLRAALPPETTLIGFSGAPWTLATYMIEGGTSKQFTRAKTWAFSNPDGFGKLISLLEDAVVAHLCAQVQAGAEALQIFDSWAGALPPAALKRWSLDPLTRIVAVVRERHPNVPIILFPRGAGEFYRDFATHSGAQGLSLDSGLSCRWAAETLDRNVVLQGNLDPIYLVAGGTAMEEAALAVLEELSGRPFIFNLGHGVVPETPPDHVARLVELVKGWSGGKD
ncbi:uroporphyrinogen decarboxylase [Limibacillus halophilus]|uniref:Uroporphyrinogen decarboxylase n=1 Tax=Limibacillus halophilus TaxID=1579333 RepID=A0A839SMB2_9PROT|nr:uroporphyrinogen decarboxylase [Limibacillus halophilus]MBB3064037.1 uroporphyrinogen decarboxylase [Limibacillus halophilus]